MNLEEFVMQNAFKIFDSQKDIAEALKAIKSYDKSSAIDFVQNSILKHLSSPVYEALK